MLTAEERDGLVSELASRPGHEKVRALLHRLLVGGLGADSRDIDFEKPAPEVRGRIDALLGRTVFELKSDLRRERREAEDGLTRYLSERQSQTGESYVGIATDGAEFVAFFLREGRLVEAGAHRVDPAAARASLAWLQGAVALGEDLLPDPQTVEREFGRGSLAARRALDGLGDLWGRIGRTTEARLKRELWGTLLGLAYGAEVGDDALFLQHTYLAIVAKAVAWAALIDEPPGDAAALLHGAAFSELGVGGQSEPDFFDWVLAAGDGRELVMRAARQVRRFRLRDIRVDILKALYESLIDPETRHDLGEYYTPDWLAARMVAAAVDDPLTQRVMDPACGSGTFLFHAMRAVLDAAGASGLSPAEAARRAAENVAGIDIHPVAVIFARVTCLLALLPALREEHPGDVSLPVWLGDALQWNLTRTGGNGEQPDFLAGDEALEIFVPAVSLSAPAPRRFPAATLRFPAAVASDTELFDRVLNAMIESGARQETVSGFAAWLGANTTVSANDRKILCATWDTMRRLQGEGRDHIWGYVARNLARPVWLASEAQRADVVIGNPPWVSFRYMSEDFQERFREECRAAQLWVGGNVSTHQDLSGYFYLRAAALYMRPAGRVALVMPYAAMSRLAYAKFREGPVARAGCVESRLRFTAAWTFGPEVSPLFPVPACVLFAAFHDGREPAPLPARVTAFAGALPKRDADAREADTSLTEEETAWPMEASDRGGSPYRKIFRQGAILVPRRLILVEPAPAPGRLPPSPAFPLVRGRTGQFKEGRILRWRWRGGGLPRRLRGWRQGNPAGNAPAAAWCFGAPRRPAARCRRGYGSHPRARRHRGGSGGGFRRPSARGRERAALPGRRGPGAGSSPPRKPSSWSCRRARGFARCGRPGPRPAIAGGAQPRATAQDGASRCDHGPSPRSRHTRCRAARPPGGPAAKRRPAPRSAQGGKASPKETAMSDIEPGRFALTANK